MEENKTKIMLTTTSEYQALSYKENKELFLMSTIHGPSFNQENRALIDVVAVIDVSGSMRGEKLKLVKETLIFLVQQLKEEDRLSLVTYDSNVTINIPLKKMNSKEKEKAQSIIKALSDGSSTNLSGGLICGLQQFEQQTTFNEVSSILLFTDGLANQGITKTEEIIKALEGILISIKRSCTIFTFGYGSDHDANMLKEISKIGKGIYYYIEKADDIPESFADCIGGLLSVVAQNISMIVEPLNSIKISEIFTHYKNTQDGNRYTINFGDLYSEEKRNILFKASLPELAASLDSFELIKFTLNYFNVLTSTLESVTSTLNIRRPEITPNQEVDPLLDEQRNRLETAQIIKQAKIIADKGELENARSSISEVILKIKKSPSCDTEVSKNMVNDLTEAFDDMSTKQEYLSKGQKKMGWKLQAHEQERSVGGEGYVTSLKMEIKSKSPHKPKK